MSSTNEFFKRTVLINRVFDAPLSLVWEAWTNPEHIAQWWNPNGSGTQIDKHDFQVGGEWQYTMIMPNGKVFIAEGVYTEIIPQQKICSQANFKPMTEGVEIQALFTAMDDKTAFAFKVIHPTEQYKIQQEKMGIQNGWGTVFNRLATFLISLK